MTPEKLLGRVFGAVGQERDTEKILLFGEFNGVVEQLRAEAFPLVFFVNDEVLKQDNKAALGGTDGKQKIDHANNGAVAAQDKDASTVRLFENQAETPQLSIFVGPEIAFLGEKLPQQLG